MEYKRIIAPTTYPLTLDEAKAHCALTGISDHDDYLAMLIDAATEAVGNYVGRQIMPATYTLTLDEFPEEILVEKPPVTAVSTVKYYDTAGALQTLSVSNYQTDLATQNGPARIKPAYGYTWPTTRPDIYGAVVVTFTAGYASVSVVPTILRHAVAFLVGHWFKQREPVITGTIVTDLPLGVEMLLSLGGWGQYA